MHSSHGKAYISSNTCKFRNHPVFWRMPAIFWKQQSMSLKRKRKNGKREKEEGTNVSFLLTLCHTLTWTRRPAMAHAEVSAAARRTWAGTGTRARGPTSRAWARPRRRAPSTGPSPPPRKMHFRIEKCMFASKLPNIAVISIFLSLLATFVNFLKARYIICRQHVVFLVHLCKVLSHDVEEAASDEGAWVQGWWARPRVRDLRLARLTCHEHWTNFRSWMHEQTELSELHTTCYTIWNFFRCYFLILYWRF